MKYFVLMMELILILCQLPAGAVPEMFGQYVAVVTSRDLSDEWTNYPQLTYDSLFIPQDWDELDWILDRIAKQADPAQAIVIDFLVHGSDDGLYLQDGWRGGRSSRATMGYLVNHIQKVLLGRRVCILLESCYAGRAYKKTIRGSKLHHSTDHIEDFVGIPPFPIWGTGDNSPAIGLPMYIQLRMGFRKWWIDLVNYDELGKNLQLSQLEPEDKKGWTPTMHAEFQLFVLFLKTTQPLPIIPVIH